MIAGFYLEPLRLEQELVSLLDVHKPAILQFIFFIFVLANPICRPDLGSTQRDCRGTHSGAFPTPSTTILINQPSYPDPSAMLKLNESIHLSDPDQCGWLHIDCQVLKFTRSLMALRLWERNIQVRMRLRSSVILSALLSHA